MTPPYRNAGALVMETDSLPTWLQHLMGVGAVIGASFGAIFFGKKGQGQTEGQATVLAGAITDRKALEQMMDALDELKREMRQSREQSHSDSLAERDCIDNLTRALDRATDAHRGGGVSADMLAMLARLDRSGK